MRGGKRLGAGRPPGAKTKRTQELARAAAAAGVTPLEVMLETMRTHHAAGDLDAASAVAKDAAPYLHPRLAAIAQMHSGDISIGYIDAPAKETREEWLARHGRPIVTH